MPEETPKPDAFAAESLTAVVRAIDPSLVAVRLALVEAAIKANAGLAGAARELSAYGTRLSDFILAGDLSRDVLGEDRPLPDGAKMKVINLPRLTLIHIPAGWEPQFEGATITITPRRPDQRPGEEDPPACAVG